MERDELWLRLHELAVAFHDEGLTREERLQVTLRQYQAMSPTVRRELLGELRMLAIDLFDLLPLVVTTENDLEQTRQQRRATG
jgi:hypothetical protein